MRAMVWCVVWTGGCGCSR